MTAGIAEKLCQGSLKQLFSARGSHPEGFTREADDRAEIISNLAKSYFLEVPIKKTVDYLLI